MTSSAFSGSDRLQDTELKGKSEGSDPDGVQIVLLRLSESMTTCLRDTSPMRQIARFESIPTGDVWNETCDYDEPTGS